MSKQALLYRLTFPNGKIYIGLSTKSLKERVRQHLSAAYHGKSKTVLVKAIRKYEGNFSSEVLCVGSLSFIQQLEISAIERFKSLYPNGYNLAFGGEISAMLNPHVADKVSASLTGRKLKPESIAKREATKKRNGTHIPTQETRQKLSAWQIGRKMSPEAVAKAVLSKKMNGGNQYSDEARKKISDANKGKVVSEITRKKISEAQKGKIIPTESIEKMRKALTGRKLSDAHVQKTLATKLANNNGSYVSDETRKKLSMASMGRKFSLETIQKRKDTLKATREAKKQAALILKTLMDNQKNALEAS